ncbi:MAG TPA: tRNA 2-thiouridine(34) synthase MnmA [Patescibacteria group bacterium]|nr:tRNA 2-thiouridine(34) synthase MnmA [Patescibacteria group bacterium]
MQGKKKQKVLVGISGGVDSAVSAYVLKMQGYEVEGVFMKNWSDTTGLVVQDCPWLQDRRDAIRVAAFLDIPLHTLDFEQQYHEKVMEYFFKEYKAGRTPNPDVMCNKEIKFKLMYNWALDHGYDYLATGHYARVVQSRKSLKSIKQKNKKSLYELSTLNFRLERSVDEFKDQTYFIYNITQEQLPHLLFPIGGYKKDQVKKLAEKIGLPNARRKESMGLCFVGKVRLREFLEQKISTKPGSIVDTKGEVLGTHNGLWNFTLGQRHGIELSGGPWYVVKKYLTNNELVVSKDPAHESLQFKSVEITELHWIGSPETLPLACKARYRHQGELVPATLIPQAKGIYKVTFTTKQNAVASGQSIVLYAGNRCLGGGLVA